MSNKILEKYKQGVPSIGTFSHLRSMNAVECLGSTGLDYVVIDMEHSATDISEAQTYMTAADAAGLTPIVRIPEVSRGAVLKSLDAGAKGVIVPGIETVEQVKTLISYAKFKPLGNRGYCPTRDGAWGFGAVYADGMNAYMESCNAQTLLLPQCETMGALEHIEEITALDGVDGIMVGPFDLSIAMGINGQFDNPDFKAALTRICKACKDHGKLSMIFTGTLDVSILRAKEGFDSIMYGVDLAALVGHYKDVVEKFRQA